MKTVKDLTEKQKKDAYFKLFKGPKLGYPQAKRPLTNKIDEQTFNLVREFDDEFSVEMGDPDYVTDVYALILNDEEWRNKYALWVLEKG